MRSRYTAVQRIELMQSNRNYVTCEWDMVQREMMGWMGCMGIGPQRAGVYQQSNSNDCIRS